MRILVTGGAGYIGTHTCVELLNKEHNILVLDNFSNSSIKNLKRVEEITKKSLNFFEGDIRDQSIISKIMNQFKPEAVLHFAGLKIIGESVSKALEYYDVNVLGSLELLKVIEQTDCNLFIFSSSASVYGLPNYLPCDEHHSTLPTNPYGQSKLMVEQMLQDWVKTRNNLHAICLRYFNPIGAHPSGLIGEDPQMIPNNLMPMISQTAAGKFDKLLIFGDNYKTRDGTGERDYIHVNDLAKGHVLALEKYNKLKPFQILNLGTGSSTTVRELIKEFEKITQQKVPHQIVERRKGDIPSSFADTKLAFDLLNFKCEKSISDMCFDAWNWQLNQGNNL
mgnify:CR=1 FL=1